MRNRTFEETAAAILALFPPLDEREAPVALTLYRLLAKGGPVSSESLAHAAGVSPDEAERMLASWPDVHRDADRSVIGYGGLTLAQTRHRIRLGSQIRYTWCAWDTLFIPALVGASAEVDSACSATGKAVLLTVHPRGIQPVADELFVSLVAPDPDSAAADIVGQFCCHVQFLRGADAANEWVAKRPGTTLASLDQAWQLGRRHNAGRYRMTRT